MFEQPVDLRRFDATKDPTAGMRFKLVNPWLILDTIVASTPCARIRRWRSRLKRAWLVKIGSYEVNTVEEVRQSLLRCTTDPAENIADCLLTFSYPEIKHGLTNEGIPQGNLDQLNP